MTLLSFNRQPVLATLDRPSTAEFNPLLSPFRRFLVNLGCIVNQFALIAGCAIQLARRWIESPARYRNIPNRSNSTICQLIWRLFKFSKIICSFNCPRTEESGA